MVATYLPTTLYNVLNGANIQSLVAVGRLSAAGMRHFDPLIKPPPATFSPPHANRPQRLAEACQSPSARQLNEQRGGFRATARTPAVVEDLRLPSVTAQFHQKSHQKS